MSGEKQFLAIREKRFAERRPLFVSVHHKCLFRIVEDGQTKALCWAVHFLLQLIASLIAVVSL